MSTERPISWRDLGIPWRTILLAVVTGSAALGSAVLLSSSAAWLIARAAQMPSPADLALAAVLVRALGIGRGAFRYAERLVSHDAALRGMANLRARVYERLERQGAARALSLHRGDIVARTGSDIDALGDAIPRSIVPAGVAVLVSAISATVVGYFDVRAGLALAAALACAGLFPAALTVRSLRITQDRGTQAASDVSVAALSIVESASEHRVWGTTDTARAALAVADRELEDARDAAARPSALAAALQAAFAGAGLVAAVAIGLAAARAGHLGGPAVAVVALTPLAAFEAVGALPTAAAQWFRSRAAGERVTSLLDREAREAPDPRPSPVGEAPTLTLTGLSAAWPGARPTAPVTLTAPPGSVVGIVGESGIGKTTLLLTIAGALPPVAGSVALDGRPVDAGDTGGLVAMTAEDAHVFGTSILENLRVARGDVTEDAAREALAAVGLDRWLGEQARGLHTILGSGGLTVSGGERRRILLARVLLHAAPIHLIDEGAEHLDPFGADALRDLVRRRAASGKTTVLVTHDRSILDVVDNVIDLDAGSETE